jgi:hypothetical protein
MARRGRAFAVCGGAAAPGSVVSVTKQSSVGGAAKQSSIVKHADTNPPIIPPDKGGTVVTTSTNLKCAKGACVAKGTKP